MEKNHEADSIAKAIYTPRRQIVDLALTAGFFVFMAWVLRAHVPSENPFWITFWSLTTSACLTGVFYMALQMFRAVLHNPNKE